MKKIVINVKYLLDDSEEIVSITVQGNVKLSEYLRNISYTYGDSIVSLYVQVSSC